MTKKLSYSEIILPPATIYTVPQNMREWGVSKKEIKSAPYGTMVHWHHDHKVALAMPPDGYFYQSYDNQGSTFFNMTVEVSWRKQQWKLKSRL